MGTSPRWVGTQGPGRSVRWGFGWHRLGGFGSCAERLRTRQSQLLTYRGQPFGDCVYTAQAPPLSGREAGGGFHCLEGDPCGRNPPTAAACAYVDGPAVFGLTSPQNRDCEREACPTGRASVFPWQNQPLRGRARAVQALPLGVGYKGPGSRSGVSGGTDPRPVGRGQAKCAPASGAPLAPYQAPGEGGGGPRLVE